MRTTDEVLKPVEGKFPIPWDDQNALTRLVILLKEVPIMEKVFAAGAAGMLNELRKHVASLDTVSFWTAVMATWRNTKRCYEDRHQWAEVFEEAKKRGCAVSSVTAEVQTFESLSDPIPVFRGCGTKNIEAISWTTDEAKARWFAEREKSSEFCGVLFRGEVAKEDVFAFTDSRQEREVIVRPGAGKNIKEVWRGEA